MITRVLLCFFVFSAYADVFLENQKKIPEVVLNLKIDKNLKKQLQIKLPSNYVLLNDQCEHDEVFYEFIPQGDRPNRWNEIITIVQIPNHGKSLSQFLKMLESGYKLRKERCEISFSEEKGAKVGFLTAEIPARFASTPNTKPIPIPGKKELLVMKVIQETRGFAIVQFSKRYPATFSRKEKIAVKDKMMNYLKSCQISL
jgi:hypothetical protein